MNTPKYNIEHQIKQEIEDREMVPTRDLWTEIESQLPGRKKNRNISWFLAAACLTLMITTGFIFIKNDESSLPPKIVEKKAASDILLPTPIQLKKEETPLLVEKKTAPDLIRNPKIFDNNAISSSKTGLAESNMKEVQNQNKTSETEFKDNSKTIALLDSGKVSPIKKRFVDPSTLLFSVEHKEVIQKSKEGTNVATIDLNSK